MGKPSVASVTVGCMKGRILEKDPMNVKSAGKLSTTLWICKYMNEIILEKNLMSVRNVQKPSFLLRTFEDT